MQRLEIHELDVIVQVRKLGEASITRCLRGGGISYFQHTYPRSCNLLAGSCGSSSMTRQATRSTRLVTSTRVRISQSRWE